MRKAEVHYHRRVPVAADRQRLVEQHLGYVRALATKEKARLGGRLDLEELVAYGARGLVEAADRFDASRGLAFVTFAHYRIKGAMYDGLREMGWLSRVEYARHRAEERANAYLENAVEREAGAPARPAATLADEVSGLSDAVGALAAIFVTSLEAEPTAERVADPGKDAETRLGDVQASARVRRAVERLPARERKLVEAYYSQGRRLEEAGAELGLSKSWASRLHTRAVELLREALAEEGLSAP